MSKENAKIKFLTIRNVKPPKRNYGDAGIDFFVPEYSEKFVLDLLDSNAGRPLLIKDLVEIKDDKTRSVIKAIVVPGNCAVRIPAGIRSLIDPNYCLLMVNKSGTAVKKNLDIGAMLIDANYEGELHIHLTNTSVDPVQILFGEKIVQGMVINHYADEFEVVDGTNDYYSELEDVRTEFYKDHNSNGRGNKGFGQATGKV